MAYEAMAKDDPDALGNAFMAYNAAYRRDSLDAQTVAHIASIFNDNKQYVDAVSVTETYRTTDTLNVDVNRQNAKAYCMLKYYKTSINRYEALKAMNRYPEALKEWNSLLQPDSTDAKVLIELAECYRLTNRTQDAALCYGRAVSLQPDNKFFRQQHIQGYFAVRQNRIR